MTPFKAIEDPTGEFFVTGPDGLKIYCPTKKEAEDLAHFLNEKEKDADWFKKMRLWLSQDLASTAELEAWLAQQEKEEDDDDEDEEDGDGIPPPRL